MPGAAFTLKRGARPPKKTCDEACAIFNTYGPQLRSQNSILVCQKTSQVWFPSPTFLSYTGLTFPVAELSSARLCQPRWTYRLTHLVASMCSMLNPGFVDDLPGWDSHPGLYKEVRHGARTFEFLLQIDRDIEAEAAEKPCLYCGDKLHRASYSRKPRALGLDLPADFSIRPSFCCSRDGCRRRLTPPLLRFLGRTVYVSIVVVIVAAMTQGASPKRLSALKSELGIAPRTIKRWCRHWQVIFTGQSSWRYQRGKLMPPIDESNLPLSLLVRFEQSTKDRLSAILCLLHLAGDCSLDPPPQRSQ